ncbi:MAG: acyl-CoA dehydratase activase [Desulfosarcinaceae bacterium]|jgi:(R)-2-hydroxyacyl-CoA dehydratese activating ATPase
MAQSVFVGIDIGASRTKVAVLDADKQLLGRSVKRSGTDYVRTADACLAEALTSARMAPRDIAKTVATGYGRNNVPFADDVKTEIACHAKGCYHYFPQAISIIDIGGQDNKIIKLDDAGLRIDFKMNRKCAAGTGAFLEEMALRLTIPLEEMNAQAARSTEMVKLGSYCTVFSGTEVLEHIRNGKQLPDIVKGLFFSVIKRVTEMDALTGSVVMTGGVVAHNPYLVEMAAEMIQRKIWVPPYPQFTGAIGAAILAMNRRV